MYDPTLLTVAESIQAEHRAVAHQAHRCATARGVSHTHQRARGARMRQGIAQLLIAVAHALAPDRTPDYSPQVVSS